MTTASAIYMATILALVWGGFAWCLLLLATGRDAGPTRPGESQEDS